VDESGKIECFGGSHPELGDDQGFRWLAWLVLDLPPQVN